MMKVSDTPERWVIIKILLNNNTYYKVFGAYSGTYLTGERWQINSGIHKATQDDEYFYFEGYSGSCYKCLKAAYGVRGTYITGVLNTIIEESGGKAKVVEEKEDWEELEKFLNINLKVK